MNLLSINTVHEQETAKQMAQNVYLQENLPLMVLKQNNLLWVCSSESIFIVF